MTAVLRSIVPPAYASPGVYSSPTAYFLSPMISPSTNSGAVTADRIYYQPIALNGLVNRIGIEVTTGAAGAARLGLYTNVGGLPGALIVDAGTVDTTNIALVEATISITLGGEWVWMASVFNAAPTVRVGGSSGSVAGAQSPSVAARGFRTAFTYAALPASAPAPSVIDNGAIPAMWLRQA